MKRFILFLAVSWLFFISKAQYQARIDSILEVIKSEKSEKEQIKLYNQLAGFYDGFELSGTYSFKALKLAEKNNDIDGKIDAFTQLSYFYYGNYIMDYDSAKICIDKAIGLCKQHNRDLKLATIYFRYARIIHFSNQSADIIPYYQKAYEIFNKYNQPRNVAFVWFLSGLYFYNINYPDSAYYYFQKELDLGKKLRDPFIELFAMNHLATNYKPYDKQVREKYFKMAEQIIQHTVPNDSDYNTWYREVAWLYRNYANIIFNQDYELALKYFNLSLENVHKADRNDNYNYDVCFIKSTAYARIFEIYLLQKQYDKARQMMHVALSEFTNPENKAELANSYENFSYYYTSYGKFSDALDCIEKALYLRTKINDKAFYVNTLYAKAEIYRKAGDFTKQKETFQKLLSLEIPKKFSYIHFFIHAYMARIYIQCDNMDSATIHMKIASEVNDKLQIPFYTLVLKSINSSLLEKNNQLDSAISLNLAILKERKHIVGFDYSKIPAENALARMYLAKNDYKNAIYYATEGLKWSNDSYVEFQAENYNVLYDANKRLGNCDLALQYHEKYLKAKEEADSDEAKREIQKKEFEKIEQARELEVQKLEQENNLRKAKIHLQKTLNFSFAGGSILLLVIIFVTYRSYKHKKAANIVLSQQKEEILAQNEEIASQRDMLFQQKKDIMDSIEYAKYIQQALLTSEEVLHECNLQSFVFYLPRNIVSGDFYWFRQINKYIYFAAADCTGHGVPGAFMSVLGISLLNEVVVENELSQPAEILNKLRRKVIKSLQQDHVNVIAHDGIDISLCMLDTETRKIQFAGAYNPLLILRDSEVLELEADHMPVGVHPKLEVPFTNREFQLEKSDTLYVFSDGFESQFGGEDGKKFNMKRFKELLKEICIQPMEKQIKLLENRLVEWRGNIDQIDDVMVVGIRI